MNTTNPSPTPDDEFEDLSQVFDSTMSLPIKGKVYTFAQPSAETGLRCKALVAVSLAASDNREPRQADVDVLVGIDSEQLGESVLGSTRDQLVTDGISAPEIDFVAQTLVIWVGAGRAVALGYWKSGGRRRPEAPGLGNRASRRSPSSTSTGAGSKTRRRGSGNGTNSRKR